MKKNLVVCGIAAAFLAALLFACANEYSTIPANPYLQDPVKTASNPMIPLISGHPQSAVYTVGTQAAALSVTAETDNGTLSYQWFHNTTNSNTEGIEINGATKASYTPPTDTTSTVYYYAKVINTIAGKTAAVSSNAAKIEVNVRANAAVPLISSHPQDAVYTLNASPVILTVTAGVNDGGTLTYQWYRNTVNSNTSGTLIFGIDRTGYPPPTTSLGAVYYYVVITNTIPDNGDGGNKTAVAHSITARIAINDKVNAEVPVITVQPQSAAYALGSSPAPLTVEASVSGGGTLLYQWFRNDTDSNAGGTMIPGAYEKDYTPPPNTAGTAYYFVVITNTIENNGDGGSKTAVTHSDTVKITTVTQFFPGTGGVALSPVDTTADITVVINELVGSNMAVVSCTNLPTGITFNSGNNTLTYDGTTAFINPSIMLEFLADTGSAALTTFLNINVYDGQAQFDETGNDPDRRIPITQANIAAFNTYANTADGLTRHYKLIEPITLTVPSPGASNWTAIATIGNRFTGSFDGQGYTIANLTFNATPQYQGMFGCTGNGSTVQNLGLIGNNINGRASVGGIVGQNAGMVQNCYTTGSVSCSDAFVGGVAGENSGTGTIQNCYATGSVTGHSAGGVAGTNSGMIQNCYATGSIDGGSSGSSSSGGVVGWNYRTIQNCYATGSVSSNTSSTATALYTGGVLGGYGNIVQNCVALNPSVITINNSSNTYIGRVMGFDSTNLSISNNYARSDMALTYNDTTYTPTSNSNGKDGADITAAEYNSYSWWTTPENWYDNTGWDFTDIWEWNSTTNLPILRNMPAGVQNPTVQ